MSHDQNRTGQPAAVRIANLPNHRSACCLPTSSPLMMPACTSWCIHHTKLDFSFLPSACIQLVRPHQFTVTYLCTLVSNNYMHMCSIESHLAPKQNSQSNHCNVPAAFCLHAVGVYSMYVSCTTMSLQWTILHSDDRTCGSIWQ